MSGGEITAHVNSCLAATGVVTVPSDLCNLNLEWHYNCYGQECRSPLRLFVPSHGIIKKITDFNRHFPKVEFFV